MQMDIFGGETPVKEETPDVKKLKLIPRDPDEYLDFLKKFDAKHTTDDCYTPVAVYNVVADYVSGRWGIPRKNFVRPFFPGGDFENFHYTAGSVVVDNPPFSIISKIVKLYNSKGVNFFLFAPSLTLFSNGFDRRTCIICNAKVIYDNGAIVNTSFVTNLPCENVIEVLPGLKCEIERAQKIEKKRMRKLNFPQFVTNSARLGKYACNGIEMKFRREDVRSIRKFGGVQIFGGGAMISPQCAAAMEMANDIHPVEEDFEMMREIGW